MLIHFCRLAPALAKRIPYKEKKLFDRLVNVVTNVKNSTSNSLEVKGSAAEVLDTITNSFFRSQMKGDAFQSREKKLEEQEARISKLERSETEAATKQ